MTSAGESDLLGRLYPKGVVHSYIVVHQGLEYSGEVVLLDRWDLSWGKPLGRDAYFRIVLLRHSGGVDLETVDDSRIAVCIPGHASSRRHGAIQRELSTIAETRARYHASSSEMGRIVRETLESQQRGVEEKLLEEEGTRYASGSIVSPSTFPMPHRDLFAGADPNGWFERLARHLLAWAYSTSLLEQELLPRAIVPSDVPRIYEAAMSSGRSRPLEQFGPGLGLSRSEAPRVYNPEGSRVIHYIRQELNRSNGSLDAQALHLRLSHALGLTRDLATLFLLAFVHHARPTVHLSLKPGHGLKLLDGALLQGRLLTSELIPSISWPVDLEAKVDTLRIPGPVSWNDALAYTSLLCEQLTEVAEAEDPSPQERQLLRNLDSLASDIRQVKESLTELGEALNDPDDSTQEESLGRLSRLCQGDGYLEVYNLARRFYAGPADLHQDLGLVTQVLALRTSIADVGNMRVYIEGAVVEPDETQLHFDRKILVEQLSLANLLKYRYALSPITTGFQAFRETYGERYLAYHGRYHDEASNLAASLEMCQVKLGALGLLNTIPELGVPLSSDLPARLDFILGQITACQEHPDEMVLSREPVCPSCHLILGQRLPAADASQLFRDLEGALNEKNGRLSRLLAQRILRGRMDRRLESFLRIVHSSDLTGLVSTIDADLVGLIRTLLR